MAMKIKKHTICPDNRVKMKSYVHTVLSCVFLAIVLPIFSCGESISEYEPRNSDEKEIIATLIQYQAAKIALILLDLCPFCMKTGYFPSNADEWFPNLN